MLDPHRMAEAFAVDFRQLEYDLKRSGYLRPNRHVAEADWDRFAQALGSKFFDYIVAKGIAKTLVNLPPRRLLPNMQWEPPYPSPLTNRSASSERGVSCSKQLFSW